MAGARIVPGGSGRSRIATGVPVLDHLVAELARSARFELSLELAPADPEAEVDAAGAALGRAVAALLDGRTGAHGTGVMAADEALALVAVEASGRPLVASNVDLAESHVGGLENDLTSRFLHGLAETAGLTVHVRLMEGEDTEHVLNAIFKALGVALATACASTPGG